MRRIEIVLVGIIVLLLLIKFSSSIAGVDAMLFIFLTVLSVFYYAFGLFLMNGVGFKTMFRKSTYSGISWMRILGSFWAAQCLSTLVVSILFIILQYAGGANLLLIGVVSSAISVVVSLVRYQAKKDKFYLNLVYKLSVWCFAGVGIYLFYQ